MKIILVSLFLIVAIFGGSLGMAILMSKAIDKIIGVDNESWYNK